MQALRIIIIFKICGSTDKIVALRNAGIKGLACLRMIPK